MSDSDESAASDSGIPFEEVHCPGIKIETELDIEPENEYEIAQSRDSALKIEPLQLNTGSECAIEKLLEKPFRSLTYQEKICYIENDRPTEPLSGLFKPSKGRRSFTRHFNAKSYETVPWLAGCSRLGKLFCWPCLLFCPGKHVWNSTGYEDLNHFHAAVKRHRMSSHHITSFKELKQFIKMKADFCLTDQFQKSVVAHNSEVKKNRKILTHMIKAVCFLARQELFGSNSKSVNEGNYIDLLNEFADYDNEFKSLLANSAHFPTFFTDTLDILMSSVCDVVISKIKEKISQSPCVAVILDVITDFSVPLLSTSVRYVAKDGIIRETFLGIKVIPNNLAPKTLALHLLEYLQKFDCEGKLISYSCDGGVLLPSEFIKLESQVKQMHSTARFTNYYAHALDTVVAQSLGFIKKCKIFFTNLRSFSSFFSSVEMRKPLPYPVVEWKYCSKLLQTMHLHHLEIIDFMTSIGREAENWDQETLCRARGLHSLLEDFEFNFLLEIFSSIFPEIDKMSSFFQRNISDGSFLKKKIDTFKSEVLQVKDNFDLIWNRCIHVKNEPDEEPQRKRLRVDTIPTEDGKSVYRELCCEIVEATLTCIQYRLEKLMGLNFTSLLDNRKFDKFKTKFPVSQFTALKAHYEKYFDFEALKGELTVVCLDKEMHKDTVVQLMNYLVSADLVEIFPEVLKLAALILTIPAFSCSADASVSQRVKAYFEKSKGREGLSSSLAVLSIEKSLLSELRNSPTFTEDVIDNFSQKHPNISLIYRKEKLQEFLWRLRHPDGSFEMHEGGEVDMRGIYCAVSIAKLTNIYTDELFENSAEWIASCQTYEGGFAGCPEMEAHGGYAFCGLAALVLLNKEYLLNMKSFLRWVVNRQMRFEGGFQGRTNKLVDGCYSFWQGGLFPIIQGILSKHDEDNILDHERWMFHQEALQEYILICCQNSSGGLIDKPKKPRDFYHTCYTLSGLSVAQHSGEKCRVLGGRANELSPIHPLYNLVLEAVSTALQYFQKLPVPIGKFKCV